MSRFSRYAVTRLLCGAVVAALVVAALALLPAAPAGAEEENKELRLCLYCHGKEDVRGTVGGVEVSVHVDVETFSRSVHGKAGVACSQCHPDALAEMPHAEELTPVQCGKCHERQAVDHARSLHGQAIASKDPEVAPLAPKCTTCHGSHDIRSHLDPDSPTATLGIPLLCGQCHHEGTKVSLERNIPQDRILENYSLSMHGEGLFKKGLSVSAVCTSCHTSHRILPHTDPESSISPENVAKTCTKCHGMIEQVHRKVIEGRLWEEAPHQIPACVDCHAPHKKPRKYQTTRDDCLFCHGDKTLETTRNGVAVSLYVDRAAYDASMHGGRECAQCHTQVDPSRTRACETITKKVDCSSCHEGQVAQYQTSTHGTLHAAGDSDAPACLDCHSNHATKGRKDSTSPTFPRNVPTLCGRCHRAGEKAAVRIKADVVDIVQSYQDSIHGKGLLESGLTVTATCASCHSAHGELPPSDPRSTIHHANVADTCGQCHSGIEDKFKKSIHWPGNGAADEADLPTCKDCHSSHTISRVDKADFRTRMMDQCGRCHKSESETFFDTFHGKVSRLGRSEAAKCYDCHGTHGILPPDNPSSTLSRDNVVATCGQCHGGSHRRFAGYLTHATHHDQKKYPWLFWTFWGMTALLVGTLTAALLHTGAWLWRLTRTRKEWTHPKVQPGEKVYRRFNKTQRTMHLVMMLCFFTLAITGMSLKFSYAGWAQFITAFLGGAGVTGVLHRIAAIVLIIDFALHIRDVLRRKKKAGRTWKDLILGPESIVPNLHDAKEAWQSLKWFLGRGPRPKYDRFTYWEKFDYMAVFWGVAVIGSTGLVLWFPEIFTRILPGWSVNVATIIHSDEALLAVGFIFTIHFFNTHFRPDKFPMDTVIFTGRVPLEELKHDRPAEYERLVATGELESRLVDPFPEKAVRGAKVFGFFALGVGLTLIVLILYAMVFGYR